MTSFRGAGWQDKNDDNGGKLTALACHPAKKVLKGVQLTNIYKKHWMHPGLFLLYQCKLGRLSLTEIHTLV
jgi:hypothetical protein